MYVCVRAESRYKKGSLFVPGKGFFRIEQNVMELDKVFRPFFFLHSNGFTEMSVALRVLRHQLEQKKIPRQAGYRLSPV